MATSKGAVVSANLFSAVLVKVQLPHTWLWTLTPIKPTIRARIYLAWLFVFQMWVWIWANNHKQNAPGRKVSQPHYFLHLPLRVIKQISMPAWLGKPLSQVETSCLEKTSRGFGDLILFIYLFCCLFLFDIMPLISLERTVTVYSKRVGKDLLTN